MRRPDTRAMLPRVGTSSPRMTLNSVVLPVPFRPMTPHRSPRATVNETSSKIVEAPNSTASPPAEICVMGGASSRRPRAPFILRESHRQLVPVPDEWHSEQQRLVHEHGEPSLIGEHCRAQAELLIASSLPVKQSANAESLGKPPQLTQ